MEPSKKQCHEHYFFGATNLNSFSALFVCILLWSLFLISTMTPSRLPCSAPKQHLQQVESAMRGQNSLKVSSSSSGRQADRAISVSLPVSIDTIRYNHIIIPTWWHPLTPAVSDLLRPVRSLECALALGVTYGVLLGSLYSLLPAPCPPSAFFHIQISFFFGFSIQFFCPSHSINFCSTTLTHRFYNNSQIHPLCACVSVCVFADSQGLCMFWLRAHVG